MDEKYDLELIDLFNGLSPEKQERFLEYLRSLIPAEATAKAC